MNDFKNIKALGLLPLPARILHNKGTPYAAESEAEVVRASDLEKLLEQAPVVYGSSKDRNGVSGNIFADKWLSDDSDTHTALLVGVKPIERDEKAELKDWLFKILTCARVGSRAELDELAEEAQKYLEAK